MKHTFPILAAALLCGACAFAQDDCYSRLRNDTLTIGNSRIERKFVWNGGNLVTYSLTDKSSGQVWLNRTPAPDFEIPGDAEVSAGTYSSARVGETVIHP